jgi:hypothetical protein
MHLLVQLDEEVEPASRVVGQELYAVWVPAGARHEWIGGGRLGEQRISGKKQGIHWSSWARRQAVASCMASAWADSSENFSLALDSEGGKGGRGGREWAV